MTGEDKKYNLKYFALFVDKVDRQSYSFSGSSSGH
jgi:hypothetical protein